MAEHLGYQHGDPSGHGSGNSRNGTSAKTMRTDIGEVRIEVPPDRAGTFAPAVWPEPTTRRYRACRYAHSSTVHRECPSCAIKDVERCAMHASRHRLSRMLMYAAMTSGG